MGRNGRICLKCSFYVKKDKFILKNDYKFIDDYVIIYTKDQQGGRHECLIDAEDFDKINSFRGRWYAFLQKDTQCYYGRNSKYIKPNIEEHIVASESIHNIVMNFIQNDSEFVDHIDHNTLDNRKKNLRIISFSENSKNRRSRNSNNKTGYRNVCLVDGWYIVQLQIDRKNKILGKFKNVHKAGKFAKEMRIKYYGEFAGED
jgi:hypothetical protein